jgi:tripartite-type tricarboxylate transporter receptor subunit TctC
MGSITGGCPALCFSARRVIEPATDNPIAPAERHLPRWLRAGRFRDIPTVGEFVPGYESSTFYGVGAPQNTPAEIIDKLNKQINAGLADPKIKARLASLGGTARAGSPADFAKLIADETEKWGKVVRAANIKAD